MLKKKFITIMCLAALTVSITGCQKKGTTGSLAISEDNPKVQWSFNTTTYCGDTIAGNLSFDKESGKFSYKQSENGEELVGTLNDTLKAHIVQDLTLISNDVKGDLSNKEIEKYRKLVGVAVDGICTNYGQNQIVLSESDPEWTEEDAKLDYNRDGHLSCREILETFPTLLGEEVVEIEYKPAEIEVEETEVSTVE